jgi:hypothetical protein
MLRTPSEWATAVARNREIASVSDLGGACQITHGRYFWPLEPNHPGNDFDIEFIAHVLAGERRWAGILSNAYGDPCDYSVAQHSVHVADIAQLNRAKLVPDWDWSASASPAFYGLMHDASEAYLKDIPRPIKGLLRDYYPAEAALMTRILEVFDVPVNTCIKNAVRIVDNMMIFLERDAMTVQPVVPYSNENEHPGFNINHIVPEFEVWDAKTAKRRFLEKYEEITSGAGNTIPLNYKNRGYLL